MPFVPQLLSYFTEEITYHFSPLFSSFTPTTILLIPLSSLSTPSSHPLS